ncbi:MAG TPA: nuclear transport factor 2 family protein [Cellvibrionaceae bacterium]
MKLISTVIAILFSALLTASCTKQQDLNESEIRAFILKLDSYANQKNVPELAKQLSADFKLTMIENSGGTEEKVLLDKAGYVQLLNTTFSAASDYKYVSKITNITITKDTATVTAETKDSITIAGNTTSSSGTTLSTLKKTDGTLLVTSVIVDAIAE